MNDSVLTVLEQGVLKTSTEPDPAVYLSDGTKSLSEMEQFSP